MRAYYICDTQEKVRLKKWHGSLAAAVNQCRRLNAKNDAEHDHTMARYFCGDWDDVSVSMGIISRIGDWPVANDNSKKEEKMQTETPGGRYKEFKDLKAEAMNSQQVEQGKKDCTDGVPHQAGRGVSYDYGYSVAYAKEKQQ